MNFSYKFMNESLRLLALLCLALIVESIKSSGGDSKQTHDKYVVCYIGAWSVYRPGRGSFKIEDINGDLCSHVVYAFVGLNATTNTLRSIDPFYDLEENYGKGAFKRVTQLKSKYSHLKVTLAVGGWNEGSLNYSTMALEYDSRRKFINSVMEYVTKYNFDGFDLDWEFPAARGGRKEDKRNFALLVQELKEELAKKKLILTAALGAAQNVIDSGYDVQEISKHLDLMHFMCYDYHGPWDKTVGPNAPLKSGDNLNLEFSIQYLLKLGAPPEKLVVGIPTYGHTFLTDNNTHSGMGSNVIAPGPEGVFTKQAGFQGYNEICLEFQKSDGWLKFWDENSSTPFATNGNHVISYDDEKSIAEKVNLGMKYNVGGFMVWSMDTDDFHGDCGKDKGQRQDTNTDKHSYPLLRAIHRAIERYSLPDEEEIPEVDHNDIEEKETTTTTTTTTTTRKTPKSSAPMTSSPSFIFLSVIVLFGTFVLRKNI